MLRRYLHAIPTIPAPFSLPYEVVQKLGVVGALVYRCFSTPCRAKRIHKESHTRRNIRALLRYNTQKKSADWHLNAASNSRYEADGSLERDVHLHLSRDGHLDGGLEAAAREQVDALAKANKFV